ncbi:MAG: hypothetical protein OEY14_02995 [Myxococcales bacterium]|nr:hypothetical protein [Myxococcales bacterium]
MRALGAARRGGAWLLALPWLWAACGQEAPEGSSGQLAAEVEHLQAVLLSDVYHSADRHVRAALESDLPARAAALLEREVAPAARLQLQAVEEMSPSTERGRELRALALSRLEARLGTVREYARVLARGPVEDLRLVDAMRSRREAELGIVGLLEQLDAIHPLPSSEPPVEPAR